MSNERARRKVLVIGLDGATLDLVGPWAEQGQLPNLQRLMKNGSFGTLMSVPNMWSPAAWTSFMTGMNPGKHGILFFHQRVPGSYGHRYISGAARDGKTLWRILSEAGKRVSAINVPMTYPAEELNGMIISGLDAPGLESEKFTHPPALLTELRHAVGHYVLQPGIGGLVKAGKLDLAVEQLHETVKVRLSATKYVMEKYPWDLFVVVFTQTDTVQHFFRKYMDKAHVEYDPRAAARYGDVILNLFRKVDQAIGELLALAGDSTVIVLSDHGHGIDLKGGFYLNLFLEQIGLLRFKTDSTVHGSGHLGTWMRTGMSTVLRSLYSQLDKRLSRDAKLKLMGLLPQMRGKVEVFLSLGEIDWPRTKAYCDNKAGDEIWINVKGQYPQGVVESGKEYEEIRDLIIQKLYECEDLRTGDKIVSRVFKREEIYHGKYLGQIPDLLVWWNEVQIVDGIRIGDKEIPATALAQSPEQRLVSGGHRPNGMIIMSGQGIRTDHRIPEANLMDVAPSILHLFGVPIPREMDGQIIVESFEPSYLARNPIHHSGAEAEPTDEPPGTIYTEEEAQAIEERLRGMGYV